MDLTELRKHEAGQHTQQSFHLFPSKAAINPATATTHRMSGVAVLTRSRLNMAQVRGGATAAYEGAGWAQGLY